MFKKAKKGFTIVELVIVIAVIGILSGILIPTFANMTTQAQHTALRSNLSSAYTEYAMTAAGEGVDLVDQQDVFVVEADLVDQTHGYRFDGEWMIEKVAFDDFSATGVQTPVIHKSADAAVNKAKSTFGGFVFYCAVVA